MSWSRRRFLNTSLSSSTLVAMGSTTIPTFLGRSAEAARAGKTNDRILVVVQLLGGNDGLNTVVPHGIDGYNRGRRALRLPAGQLHKITAGDRLAPLDGRDGQDPRARTAGRRAGGRLSQPGPLALPIDGDLGDGQREQRCQGPRDRLAGTCPRLPAARSPATIRPVCTWAAGRCRWRSRPGRPRCPRSRASRATNFSSPARIKKSKPSAPRLNQLAGVDRRSDDPLLGFISRTTLAAYESSSRLEQLVARRSRADRSTPISAWPDVSS